ncbi:MAG TPA: PH domain-containing protein [Clostridiales bacterium]|nr:PH domain-containing protein [Clostridiales bacterium]
MEKPVRNHFSIVLVNTLKYTWFFIVMLFFNLLQDKDEAPGKEFDYIGFSILMASILIAVFLVVLLFQFIRWRKTYISINDGQLIVEKRYKIMNNKTTVKLSSISTVNLKQNILHRIFNVYNLQLDINSAVTAEKTDFNLVFNREMAFEFKRLITELNSGNEPYPYGTGITDETPDKPGAFGNDESGQMPVVSFPFSKVARHCIMSVTITGILISIAVYAGVILGLLFPEEGEVVSELDKIVALLIVIVPLFLQFISPFFRYYGFMVKKQNNRMIISYGLFTKQQYTLPLEKTSALIIRQTMLSRLFDLYYGEILNVGMGDEENKESPLFCLMVSKQELNSIIQHLAPEYYITEAIQPSPNCALMPVMMKYLILALPVFIVSIVFGLWPAGLVWLGFIILAAYLSHKAKGLGLQENKVAISSGVFSKKTIIISYSKIQNLSTTYGPVSKRLGLRKGNVTVLASLANKIHPIGYFPINEFERLANYMIEHESIEKS